MDMRILGAVLAAPALVLFSGSGGGPQCNYTKPGLVYAQACLNETCLAQVKKHLPSCKRQLSARFTKSVRHEDGVAKAPYLVPAVMDELTACISSASYGALSTDAVDLSDFREVSSDVRGNKARRVGGKCKEKPCGGMYLRPVVGQTTFLYGPA